MYVYIIYMHIYKPCRINLFYHFLYTTEWVRIIFYAFLFFSIDIIHAHDMFIIYFTTSAHTCARTHTHRATTAITILYNAVTCNFLSNNVIRIEWYSMGGTGSGSSTQRLDSIAVFQPDSLVGVSNQVITSHLCWNSLFLVLHIFYYYCRKNYCIIGSWMLKLVNNSDYVLQTLTDTIAIPSSLEQW